MEAQVGRHLQATRQLTIWGGSWLFKGPRKPNLPAPGASGGHALDLSGGVAAESTDGRHGDERSRGPDRRRNIYTTNLYCFGFFYLFI